MLIMTERIDKSITLPIRDAADLNLALMQLSRSGIMAQASNFDLALIRTTISELSTNIIKYGVRGEITVSRIETDGDVDIDIVALDSGPGIKNVELAMQDSFSTGNTLGLGLPAVKRMTDSFSIQSTAGQGTRIHTRKRIKGNWFKKDTDNHQHNNQALESSQHALKHQALWDIATAVRPKPGEIVCGDFAACITIPAGLLLVLIDVTGHGVKAEKLGENLLSFIKDNASSDLNMLMSHIHHFLKGTQGAAISLMFIDTKLGCASYVGVGNTGAARVTGHPWRPVSKDGVLGMRLPTPIEQKTFLTNADLILMWTDGVSERAAKKYAEGNAYLPAQTLASRIVSDAGKPFDDAGCLIFRWLN